VRIVHRIVHHPVWYPYTPVSRPPKLHFSMTMFPCLETVSRLDEEKVVEEKSLESGLNILVLGRSGRAFFFTFDFPVSLFFNHDLISLDRFSRFTDLIYCIFYYREDDIKSGLT
jgi:hypothetical protein